VYNLRLGLAHKNLKSQMIHSSPMNSPIIDGKIRFIDENIENPTFPQ
jgi:hypothetical protein